MKKAAAGSFSRRLPPCAGFTLSRTPLTTPAEIMGSAGVVLYPLRRMGWHEGLNRCLVLRFVLLYNYVANKFCAYVAMTQILKDNCVLNQELPDEELP